MGAHWARWWCWTINNILTLFVLREKRTRPWLETPKTDFKLQCREISHESQLQPSEAALATLPHYLHPSVPMEKSEVQAMYTNHFKVGYSCEEDFGLMVQALQARGFYNAEPSKKPEVTHLQKTCLI